MGKTIVERVEISLDGRWTGRNKEQKRVIQNNIFCKYAFKTGATSVFVLDFRA